MTLLSNDPCLKDKGKVTEEPDSDYEMTFTEYWWTFECKTCGKTIYHSSSYSVIGSGTVIKCESCKSKFTLKNTYVSGKEKKPMTSSQHINPGSIVTVTPPGCVIDDSYRERKQPDREHCDHECNGDLCFRYRETMALGSLKDMKPCPAGTDGFTHCHYDTRTKASNAPGLSDHIRLNTQPEGCDCGDCLRYGKEECPYPGSNPTMIMCNSFLLNIKEHDVQVRKEEREQCIKELAGKFYAALGFPTPKGDPQDSFIPSLEASEISYIIESLRKEQQQ